MFGIAFTIIGVWCALMVIFWSAAALAALVGVIIVTIAETLKAINRLLGSPFGP